MRSMSKLPIMCRKAGAPFEERRDVRAPTLLCGATIVSARPIENPLDIDNDTWNFRRRCVAQ
jgi:hypothetical protein